MGTEDFLHVGKALSMSSQSLTSICYRRIRMHGVIPLFSYTFEGEFYLIKHKAPSIKVIFCGSTALVGQGLLIVEISRSHSDTPQSVGLLWTSDRSVAVTSTWQHTTPTRDRHPCLRRDANPQFQQTRGRRPTPYRWRGNRDRR